MSAEIKVAKIPKNFQFTEDMIPTDEQDEIKDTFDDNVNWLDKLNKFVSDSLNDDYFDEEDRLFIYVFNSIPKDMIVKTQDISGWTNSIVIV